MQMAWNKTDHLFHRLNLKTLAKKRIFEQWRPPSKFLSFCHSDDISNEFKRAFPERQSAILSTSDNICKHHFDVLGYQRLFWDRNKRVNWHFDPVNNKVSPLLWWEDIDVSNVQENGDPKVICELNRHQHFIFLAMAYLLSKKSEYKMEFAFQLESWYQCNPPKRGINWTSSLELSLRAIAWIWAYHLFDAARSFPKELLPTFVTFLWLQAEHIEHNMSTYFSPNTHITGEALGLVYIGIFLSGCNRSEKWVELGSNVLIEQLPKHVLCDGGYMERSLWYHRYTLEIYLHFLLLSRNNQVELAEAVERKIEDLAEFLLYASCPDRTFPLIGDDDGGRLLVLDSLKGNDLRGLFSTLAVLLNRGDFKYLSSGFGEETFWLLGPKSKVAYERIESVEPECRSKAFKETGYFFMRNDWSDSSPYLAFDCGPHGWLNCGHAHADLLSFHLTSGIQSLIVDPGAYCYSGEFRDHFRGPDYHSLIKIDGFYPAIVDDPFHWKMHPQHELVEWIATDAYDYVSGRMKGNVDWSHQRRILFIKPDVFVILDTVNGAGYRDIEIRFPLHGKEWCLQESKCASRSSASSIECVLSEAFETRLLDSWTSPYFGVKVPSYTLCFSGSVNLPHQTAFLINLSDKAYEVSIWDGPEGSCIKLLSKESNLELFQIKNLG